MVEPAGTARSKALLVPTDGPCAGHPCDDCDVCRSGTCCRAETPLYDRPRQGSWEGPYHGELGLLAIEPAGERVQCHICGQWFDKLGSHVWRVHGVRAKDYRALFGLRQRTPLASERYSAEMAETNAGHLERLWAAHADDNPVKRFTPEQRSSFRRGTGLPLETLLDPKYQEARKRVGALTTARAQRFYCKCGCGELLPPGWGRKDEDGGRRYLPGHYQPPPSLPARVLRTLHQAQGRALSCSEVLLACAGEGESEVRRALGKLVQRGQAVQPKRGFYAAAVDAWRTRWPGEQQP